MKTIALKLTKSESKLFDKSTENTPLGKLLNMVVFKGDGVVKVLDADKFREFLNDEIDKCFPVTYTTPDGIKGRFTQMESAPNGVLYEGSESQKQDNLKSILSKLGEVK